MEQIHKNHSIGYIKAYGNFGELYGEVKVNNNSVEFSNENIKFTSRTEEFENGVYLRRDEIENISDKVIKITNLKSQFTYTESDYEVYTQCNTWQHESAGNWANLSTVVATSCESNRTSGDAAPFLVLWDKQVSRGMAYHIIPTGSWEMSVLRRHAFGEQKYVCVEMGFESRRFCLSLEPGEKVQLPEIVYYETTNKTDLDGWKIHSYWNKVYPRRELPVVYNTWLARFDNLDFESIKEQILLAEEIGAEYFVTDAGWFGYGTNEWWQSVGDWVENTQLGYAGRMKEVSDLVRQHSMKFGLWFEPERALIGSKSYTEHPEYYMTGSTFYYGEMAYLDYSNPEARNYMIDLIGEQIENCKIEYIKFDCNMDLLHDIGEDAFISYFKGYDEFFTSLRKKYPQIYWENCGGGGGRLDLANCKYHDSFWFTDNQNIYDSADIIKHTILRMPPQVLDRWVTIGSIDNVTPNKEDKIYSIGDAAWNHTVGVNESYLSGFLTGGPLGLTFDLTKISKDVFESLKSHIVQFKNDREFWKNAVCRILADGSEVFVLQYSSEDFTKNVLQLFVKRNMQKGIRVYPALNPELDYISPDGKKIKGKAISEKGIYIPVNKLYSVSTLVLESE